MIKVDEPTHARLARLAAEHGTTIGGYVGELARTQRTQAELAEISRQSADYLREQFGFNPTPEEKASFLAEYRNAMVSIAARRGRLA